MAQVPVSQGGRVALQPLSGAKFQAADFGSSGEAIGKAVARFGGSVADYADYRERLQGIEDQAVVKEATNAVNSHYAEIGFTGPNAYYSKQGKDALLTRPTVEKSLDSFIGQTREGFQSERQRQMFDRAIEGQRVDWAVQIARHSETQTLEYEKGESASRVGMAAEMAKLTYLGDPDHGEKQLQTALGEIDNQARLEGWGPERVAVEKLKLTSGTYKDVGTRLAYEGGAYGPELAEAFVDKHKDSMTSDDRETVLGHARVQKNALEAEQRRIEAEARRNLREDKRDAKDRADSVYRNIQDGVVVEPKDLQSAIDDAKFAGDDALAEGLRQGGLKNDLTIQYANATPAELQDAVNALSTEITKAGGKVDADTVVKRDHLQTMLNKANSEISNDQLSYGAGHYGVEIGPYSFKDPGSIERRISAATTIARRTGRPPQPLTNEEASQLSATWTAGTTEQKVGLALNLAKFGPLALVAATQVAPNDAGFQNVVGLATHQNRAVAMFRVNQVMTGQDVLKSKPKLVDRAQATQQFNDLIGTSLQFLPQVARGAYSNAVAILASEANKEGWSDWTEAQRRWPLAVGEALGAYDKDGKRYGGLVEFNGTTTILPENMDQATFEERVSRAKGPQFKAASGMQTPVFADGRHPTASEVKKMQWIPVGDGRYRITDGHGFIRTTSGGFYEIDARKL